MKLISLAAALAVAVLAVPSPAQELGKAPPELDALQWYNAPSLGLKDLRGRAVLVEVFRTW